MSKPLVGITCRHEEHDPKRTHHNIYAYDYQFTRFAERVARAGGIPVWLPNIAETLKPAEYLDRVDVLVLSGGEDVHPKRYHEKIDAENLKIREARDAFELALARGFWEQQKPVFAVCRGIQVLNVALGGSLYQDLSMFPNAEQHTRNGNEYLRTHPVRIIPGSRLARVCGCDELTVNTSHHQMIKDIAPGLRAVAWSTPDGIIEGVEAADGRAVIGVQWHPEMMDDEPSNRLFHHVVNSKA
jgi:putative glutamine amidotransferase